MTAAAIGLVILPDVARDLYLSAKTALDRRDRGAAVREFDTLLTVIDSAAPAPGEPLAELRLLAAGFLDLARAVAEPPVEPAPTVAAPAPEAAAPITLTAPVALKQDMPKWMPADAMSRQRDFTGAVKVRISAAGIVETAEILTPVHPTYDRLLLQAAKGWLYQPARRNGAPVSSEQVIEVRLRPQ